MKSPISLEHTVEEINSILTALAAKPYAEVAELIHKIKNKAEAQIVEAAKAVEEEFTPPADQPPQA
jgi:HPt (histidine-containing phosphotransfer) domain-containing protein